MSRLDVRSQVASYRLEHRRVHEWLTARLQTQQVSERVSRFVTGVVFDTTTLAGSMLKSQSQGIKRLVITEEGKRMASGLTRNQVPGNRLRVRIPCPPLIKASRVNELRLASFFAVL